MKNKHIHSSVYYCIPKSHKKSFEMVSFRYDDILEQGQIKIEHVDCLSIFNPDLVYKFPDVKGFKETYQHFTQIIKEVKNAQLNDSGCPTDAARCVAESYAQQTVRD